MNIFLLLLLGTIWGSSYLFIKIAVADVPVFTLVAGRLFVSALILWGIVLLSRREVPRSRSVWGAYTMMGLFSGALPYVLITWGEQYISSGLAALLQATMPFFTVIMANWLTAEERMTWASAAGVALGFVGVGLLMLPDLRAGLHANLLGQLAIVAASVSYAWAAIFARKRLRDEPPLMNTLGQLTMGAMLTLPLSLIVEQPFDLSPSAPALWSWLGLIVLGTVVAYVIFYELIERTSATFVSMVTYVIPVNGLIMGALVLDETLTPIVVVSLLLILSGVVLVRR